MFKHHLQFFNQEPASGPAGDGTGEAVATAEGGKEVNAHTTTNTRLRNKKVTTRDFLNNAPVVKKDGLNTNPHAEPGQASKEEPGEPKVLVQGPGANIQQPGAQQTPGNPEVPNGEGPTNNMGTVQIGDQTYTVEQLEAGQQALLAQETDKENRTKWQEKLTQKSQLVNAMPDELVKEVLTYATMKKGLPDDIKDVIAKNEEIPKSFKITDADDYEIEINTSELPKEFLNQLANAVLAEKMPEFFEAMQQADQLTAENTQLKETFTEEQMNRGMDLTIQFMGQHPEYAVTLREGEDLKQILANVVYTGKDHPEYENALRLATILQGVNEGFYQDLEQAHKVLYQPVAPKVNATNQVLNNQNSNVPEKPGSPADKDKTKTFLLRNKSVKSQKIMNLGR